MVTFEDHWDNEMEKLEQFYATAELPKVEIEINSYTMIHNAEAYVKAKLGYLRENPRNKTYLPYLLQLRELKRLIEAKTWTTLPL